MKRSDSILTRTIVTALVVLGLSGASHGQVSCDEVDDDDLWDAGPDANLPNVSPNEWTGCRSEINGSITNLSPDGWVLEVVDDLGQDEGEDEDRSAYCKANIFSLSCQDAVYELSVRTISGDSNPPHSISDIVLFTGLRDGAKDLTIVVTTERVGFINGITPLNWLQIDDGNGGTMPARVDVGGDPGDTNDKQHIYRVEKDGQDTITLFVDNVEELSFDYDELTDHAFNQSTLAATSGPGESEFRLRYYRHRIGSTEFQTPSVGCDADFDSDDDVDVADMLALLDNWGACPVSPATCPWDIDDDGRVGVSDLLSLLASWGPCT